MKKGIMFLLSLALIIGLAACSNSNDNDKQNKKTTKKGEMKIGEMMYENKTHIFPIITDVSSDGLDEDSPIDRYIVTKNGKMKVYTASDLEGLRLKDIAEKSDKELLKSIKMSDEADFKVKQKRLIKHKKQNLKDVESTIETGKDTAVVSITKDKSPKEMKPILEKTIKKLEKQKYKAPEWRDVKITASSDNKEGVNVEKIPTARNFNFAKDNIEGDDTTDTSKSMSFISAMQPQPFGNNDSIYAGLANKDENSDSDDYDNAPYIITKVSDKVQTVYMDKNSDPNIEKPSK